MSKKQLKIAVLTSGGVDSSVALKLLQSEGHDVTAFYLKIWLEDELSFLGDCPWEQDLSYLNEICATGNIPLRVINFQREYHAKVVGYALREIRAGRTPNSDMICNSKVKFGSFFDVVGKEFDMVASGHYANKTKKNRLYYLTKAKDALKDQTYFLARLTQKQLKKSIFPLGTYQKKQIRKIAKDLELPNKNRKDSQGICFLGKIKYNDFVRQYLGEKKGDLIDWDNGKKLGEHRGYWFFTIGQRKGIELSGGPWFVIKKDVEKNIVYVSSKYKEPEMIRNSFEASELHWITGKPSKEQIKNLRVKIRHGENSYKALFKPLTSKRAEIKISGCDQGFAPGQFVVFYSGKFCLGCGTIA